MKFPIHPFRRGSSSSPRSRLLRPTAAGGAFALVLGLVLIPPSATGTPAAAPQNPAVAPAAEAPDPGPFPDIYPPGSTYKVPGERDGTSEFPVVKYDQVKPEQPGVMDFEHFHTSVEMEWWMRKWAHEHPDIVDLYEVGKSFGGRPILQLTITDKSTGAHTTKPAAFFEGGRHSGEITSSESAFWLAWHLIENNGKDEQATRIVRDRAVYVRPLNNPDGSDMYRLTAQTNRSTVRPHDTDTDGKLDEDAGEDLDGDGYLTSMRQFVGAGKGTHVIDDRDPAKRVMRSVGAGQGDYLVFSEGIDSDGDGAYNEDGIGGLDLHRNYPYNWRPEAAFEATKRGNTQFGAGQYPLSEPETRSVFNWLLSHPNTGVVNSMDTAVPMHLRGPSTCEEDECMERQDLKLFEHYDELGLEFTDYPWAGNVYRDYATRNGGDPQALYGHGPDFGYFQFGAIWYGDELWGGGRFKDYDGDELFADWERSRWCVDNDRDDCFLGWNAVDHPKLGKVEVGGFNPKFWNQNAPADMLEEWAVNQAKFNLAMTDDLPAISITGAKVKKLGGSPDDGATHEIKVKVRNAGFLPTAMEIAKRIKIVRPDTVTATLPTGGRVIEAPEFFLDGDDSESVTLRVALPSGGGDITLKALSTRGGEATKTVSAG